MVIISSSMCTCFRTKLMITSITKVQLTNTCSCSLHIIMSSIAFNFNWSREPLHDTQCKRLQFPFSIIVVFRQQATCDFVIELHFLGLLCDIILHYTVIIPRQFSLLSQQVELDSNEKTHS